MPRDVSLSDRKCWNGGQKWAKGQVNISIVSNWLTRFLKMRIDFCHDRLLYLFLLPQLDEGEVIDLVGHVIMS